MPAEEEQHGAQDGDRERDARYRMGAMTNKTRLTSLLQLASLLQRRAAGLTRSVAALPGRAIRAKALELRGPARSSLAMPRTLRRRFRADAMKKLSLSVRGGHVRRVACGPGAAPQVTIRFESRCGGLAASRGFASFFHAGAA